MKLSLRSLRLVPGVLLAASLLMLILGTTVLSSRLHPAAFVIYWLLCFLLTGTAAIFALAHMALIRRQQRREQQELISQTVAEAKKEAARNPSSET